MSRHLKCEGLFSRRETIASPELLYCIGPSRHIDHTFSSTKRNEAFKL